MIANINFVPFTQCAVVIHICKAAATVNIFNIFSVKIRKREAVKISCYFYLQNVKELV